MSRMIRLLVVLMFAVTGFAGVINHAGAQERATGTVRVLKYYCTYLDSTLLVEAIDLDACSPGAATFSFYLVGDGTNEFQLLDVGAGGEGTIELAVGDYEMIEEGSQTHFMISVVQGQTVQLLIANPAVEAVPTVPAPAPTTVPAPAPPLAPVPPQAAPAAPTIKLPNTGSGVSTDSETMTLTLAAMAAIAGGGAMTLRKMRPT